VHNKYAFSTQRVLPKYKDKLWFKCILDSQIEETYETQNKPIILTIADRVNTKYTYWIECIKWLYIWITYSSHRLHIDWI